MKIRKPVVAGSFYPEGKEELTSFIRELELQQQPASIVDSQYKRIIGGIVPHAGYTYSGKIALPFFQVAAASEIQFQTIIILHPNHYGYGPEVALDTNEMWKTPFGLTAVDLELARVLGFEKSDEAHRFEHSAEVMLPFLQYFLPYSFQILPVALSRQDYYSSSQLADKIRKAIKLTKRRVLIIASSDFSHFVSPTFGFKLDNKAISHIYALETEKFYNTVIKHKISICGYGPIMVLMEFVKPNMQEIAIELLARGHSGEVTHSEEVVHYASILFYNRQ